MLIQIQKWWLCVALVAVAGVSVVGCGVDGARGPLLLTEDNPGDSLGVAGSPKDGMPSDEQGVLAKPVTIAIDPRDPDRYDRIRQSTVDNQFKEQVAYLQDADHDLDWYPSDLGEVRRHDTVQLLYFDEKRNVVTQVCSGVFVSDDYIASAGHCNTRAYLGKDSSCKGLVVFAYKSAFDSPITYIQCQKVVELGYERIYQPDLLLREYTLFKVADSGTARSLRPTFSKGLDRLVRSYNPDKPDAYIEEYGRAVALVVDPPSMPTTYNLRSKYNVIVGKFLRNTTARVPGHFFVPTWNAPQEGNSGSPVYAVRADTNQVFESDDWVYVSPLSAYRPLLSDDGEAPWKQLRIAILTDPRIALGAFLDVMQLRLDTLFPTVTASL